VKGWIDGPGVSIEAGAEKGKLSIRVAPDADPGVRWIRLYDEEGATALRPFLVGTLPEVAEQEPNNDPGHPQVVEIPAVVNGRLGKPGDVDGFAVALVRGQTLVADLEANRHLGSPMDAVLQVATPAGVVLMQNDDDVGRDPRVVFRAPADGTYLIRAFAFPATPDSGIRFAGGEAFVYRLTVTAGGFLDHAFPLAVSRDGPGSAAAIGHNVPEEARRLVVPEAEAGRDVVSLSHPLLAGTAEARGVEGPAAEEAEPDDPDRPQDVPEGVAISGRIDPPGDRDAFRLALKKGDKRKFRVEARSLGRPVDPVVRVLNGKGDVLAEVDDSGEGRDAELPFVAPEDGPYRVVVFDLNGRGGPRHAYLLRVLVDEPDFALSLTTDRFEATAGQATKVVVNIQRKGGFAGPIEIAVEGRPDGIATGPVVSQMGQPSAKAVTLELTAEAGAQPGPFRIIGTPVGGGQVRPARATIEGVGSETDRLWLSIRPPQDPAK
jgi:hypothetical protein